MGCANECDQFTRKREKHEPENNTITRMDGIYMEMLGNRRTQGAAGSFDQKRMGKRMRIINIMLNNILLMCIHFGLLEIKFKTRMSDQDTSLWTKAPQHLKQNMNTA